MNSHDEKLPLEYPLDKAIRIYTTRIVIVASIVLFNFLMFQVFIAQRAAQNHTKAGILVIIYLLIGVLMIITILKFKNVLKARYSLSKPWLSVILIILVLLALLVAIPNPQKVIEHSDPTPSITVDAPAGGDGGGH